MVKGDHSKIFLLLEVVGRGVGPMAHVILVSDPVPIGLWIYDCFRFGISSTETGLGTGA